MGATTEGVGGHPPQKKLDGPPTFYVAFWVGVTDCAKLGIPFYFLEKGSTTRSKKLDPPTLKTCCAPAKHIRSIGHTRVTSCQQSVACVSGVRTTTFQPDNLYGTVRYDTRCYFNVRSKADISRLNLPHGDDN